MRAVLDGLLFLDWNDFLIGNSNSCFQLPGMVKLPAQSRDHAKEGLQPPLPTLIPEPDVTLIMETLSGLFSHNPAEIQGTIILAAFHSMLRERLPFFATS